MTGYKVIYSQKQNKKHVRPIELELGFIGLLVIVVLDLLYTYVRGKFSFLLPVGIITPILLLIIYLLIDKRLTLINQMNTSNRLYNNALILQNAIISRAPITIVSNTLVKIGKNHRMIALPDNLIDTENKIIDFKNLK